MFLLDSRSLWAATCFTAFGHDEGEGGDGRYISKLRTLGPAEIGGSSGDADGGS
jgi:hypothetical protein